MWEENQMWKQREMEKANKRRLVKSKLKRNWKLCPHGRPGAAAAAGSDQAASTYAGEGPIAYEWTKKLSDMEDQIPGR